MAAGYTSAQREAVIAERLAYLSTAIRLVPFGTERESFAFQAFLALTDPVLTPIPDTKPPARSRAALRLVTTGGAR